MSEQVEARSSAEQGPLPEPVLVENGDVLVPVHDTDASGGASVVRLSPDDDDYAYWLGRVQEAARGRSIAKRSAVVGKVAVLVGSVMLIVSTFITYASAGGVSLSLWQSTTRFPVILTVLAAGTMVVIALSFFLDRVGLALSAMVVSAFLLGETFPLVFDRYSPFGAGFWLGVGGAAIMCVGSVLIIALRSKAAGSRSAPSEPSLRQTEVAPPS